MNTSVRYQVWALSEPEITEITVLDSMGRWGYQNGSPGVDTMKQKSQEKNIQKVKSCKLIQINWDPFYR